MGRASTGVLVQVGETYLDDTAVYNAKGVTDRVAPAGAGGECIFTSLYVTTIHKGAVKLKVTPIVDGTSLESSTIALTVKTARTTTVHEIGVSIPYKVGGVEVSRYAARGTWFQTQVETIADDDESLDYLRVDAVELEHEVVRESLAAVTASTGGT